MPASTTRASEESCAPAAAATTNGDTMSSLDDAARGPAGPSGFTAPATASGTTSPALFGQTMGLVAVTVGFTALGAYIGRDLAGGWGIAALAVAFVLLLALNVAVQRSHSAAVTTLFAIGLLLGLALGPGLAAYTAADPAAVWQAAGTTALFIAALGSFGWATRRDLSSVVRVASWALLVLIVFAIVAIFVAIPGANAIWAVAGLAIFAAFTAYDFQRLRLAGAEEAVPIAASIFLDVLNVFQLLLLLFGGGGSDE